MTLISLETGIVQDLINTKLQVVDEKIQKNLTHWKMESVDQLIKEAKSGELEEAGSDVIEIQNLMAKRDGVEKLYPKL